MMLHFRKLGKGHPIVILHGVFGSSDNWQTIGKQLADHYTVYLVDQRNHGQSFHSDGFDYQLMSEDLRLLLDKEGVLSCHLIGHSMGGKTAMHFSSTSSNMVDKLVVIDIAPKAYPPHHEKIFEAFNRVSISALQSRGEAENSMKAVIEDPGIRQFLLKNLKRDSNGFTWKLNIKAIERNIENIGTALPKEYGFKGQTLFIRGANSNYIMEEDNQMIKDHFPEARILSIENAGHWVHAEQPIALMNELSIFLNSIK